MKLLEFSAYMNEKLAAYLHFILFSTISALKGTKEMKIVYYKTHGDRVYNYFQNL